MEYLFISTVVATFKTSTKMKKNNYTIGKQTRKKIIFVREPEFGFGNVRTIHLDKFAK